MTEQDCSPMGQRAKGKIPNNPLFKGSTLPSSCARGEISNTRTFWGGQIKTITASSSQLSSDTRAPDCPSRTSVIQPSSTFLLHHCRLLPLLPLLRNPSQSLDFQEAWLHICCCTDGPPSGLSRWSPPPDSAHIELIFEHLPSISQLLKPITQSHQNLGKGAVPACIPNLPLKETTFHP